MSAAPGHDSRVSSLETSTSAYTARERATQRATTRARRRTRTRISRALREVRSRATSSSRLDIEDVRRSLETSRTRRAGRRQTAAPPRASSSARRRGTAASPKCSTALRETAKRELLRIYARGPRRCPKSLTGDYLLQRAREEQRIAPKREGIAAVWTEEPVKSGQSLRADSRRRRRKLYRPGPPPLRSHLIFSLTRTPPPPGPNDSSSLKLTGCPTKPSNGSSASATRARRRVFCRGSSTSSTSAARASPTSTCAA